MLALIASALLGLYLFLPDFLFTRLTAQFAALKKHQRTKFEDIMAGVTVAAIPFVLTLLFSHVFWFFGHWPFPIPEAQASKWADYRTVFSAAYSDSYFNAHQEEFWRAAEHVWTHQMRFLFWNYMFLATEIWIVRRATAKFGSWHRNPVYRKLFGTTILRRVSQWNVLFKPFMFPPDRKPIVMLDVLTSDNHLYDGELADYFVDSSGHLQEILLKGFRRFRFKEFEEERKAAKARGEKTNPNDYWTVIPGANLLIPYTKVANINVRYVFNREATAEDLLRSLKMPKGVSVVITTPDQDHVTPPEKKPASTHL